MTAVEITQDALSLAAIPLRLIERNPANPRRDDTPEPEMVQSVREHGVVVPVIVRPVGDGDDGYILIAGHRRLAAATEAGLDRIPAIVRAAADLEAFELTLIENLHRKDLSPLEEAEGFHSLAELGLTQKQIAEKVGVSQPLVSKRIALLRLPDVARQAVEKGRDDGGISIEEAVAIAVLPDKEIKSLFRGGNAPHPTVLKTAVRSHLEAKKRRKVIDELEAAGVKVTTERPGWNDSHPPCRLGYLAVTVSEEDHEGLDCHIVYVDEHANIVACCITPENHDPEPGSELQPADEDAAEPPISEAQKRAADKAAEESRAHAAAAQAKNDEEQQRRQVLALDRDRRLAHCRDLISQPCANDILGLAAHVLPEVGELGLEAALNLLGVEIGDDDEEIRLVQGFAGSDVRTQAQAVYAMVLASAEGFTSAAYRDMVVGRDDEYLPVVRIYFRYLRDHGYELSDVEGEIVAEQLTIDGDAETEPSEGPSDEDDETEEEQPTVTVKPKGKRFLATCTACGPLSPVGNTTASYAQLSGTNHLFTTHGIRS